MDPEAEYVRKEKMPHILAQSECQKYYDLIWFPQILFLFLHLKNLHSPISSLFCHNHITQSWRVVYDLDMKLLYFHIIILSFHYIHAL